MRTFAIALLATIVPGLVAAATAPSTADGDPMRRAIAEFLTARTAKLPGPARFEIGTIKTEALPAACRGFEASMDLGARPWGRTQVRLRCVQGATWVTLVPVLIRVEADYVVSARPWRAGQDITAADLAQRRGDLAELPGDVLLDAAQAVGKSAAVSIGAERPLRPEMLRRPLVIRQGQGVRLVSSGAGFQVSGEGRAVGNAHAGQVVQVKLPSGQVLSGIAKDDGSVAVGQ